MNMIFELNEKELSQMNGAGCGGWNTTCAFNEDINININRQFGFSSPCDFDDGCGGFDGGCGGFDGCCFNRCGRGGRGFNRCDWP